MKHGISTDEETRELREFREERERESRQINEFSPIEWKSFGGRKLGGWPASKLLTEDR